MKLSLFIMIIFQDFFWFLFILEAKDLHIPTKASRKHLSFCIQFVNQNATSDIYHSYTIQSFGDVLQL